MGRLARYMDAITNATLTVDNAWFIAETIGAGTFRGCWRSRRSIVMLPSGCVHDRQRDELTRWLSPQGVINPAVADWIKVVSPGPLATQCYGPAFGRRRLRAATWHRRAAHRHCGDPTRPGTVLRCVMRSWSFTAMDIDDPRRGAGSDSASVWRTAAVARGSDELSLPGGRGPTNGCVRVPLGEAANIYLASAPPVVESVFGAAQLRRDRRRQP